MPLLNIQIPGENRRVEVLYGVDPVDGNGFDHKADIALPLAFTGEQWAVNHCLLVVANDLGREHYRLVEVARARDGQQNYSFRLQRMP